MHTDLHKIFNYYIIVACMVICTMNEVHILKNNFECIELVFTKIIYRFTKV